MLPRSYDPISRKPNPDLLAQLDAATAGPTVVVYFRTMAWREYLPTPELLARQPGMQPVYQGPDALVWIRDSRPAPVAP